VGCVYVFVWCVRGHVFARVPLCVRACESREHARAHNLLPFLADHAAPPMQILRPVPAIPRVAGPPAGRAGPADWRARPPIQLCEHVGQGHRGDLCCWQQTWPSLVVLAFASHADVLSARVAALDEPRRNTDGVVCVCMGSVLLPQGSRYAEMDVARSCTRILYGGFNPVYLQARTRNATMHVRTCTLQHVRSERACVRACVRARHASKRYQPPARATPRPRGLMILDHASLVHSGGWPCL
jgi:hypothetical protein